mmetsp:Transcript_46737/g.84380  ORF Transcript_46737/g.84380 Transcript_46737/m.84380 type:complete len:89 (-) Transcript_46737:683-949(-)
MDDPRITAGKVVSSFIPAAGVNRPVMPNYGVSGPSCTQVPDSQLPVCRRGQQQVLAWMEAHLGDWTSTMRMAIMLSECVGTHIPDVDA